MCGARYARAELSSAAGRADVLAWFIDWVRQPVWPPGPTAEQLCRRRSRRPSPAALTSRPGLRCWRVPCGAAGPWEGGSGRSRLCECRSLRGARVVPVDDNGRLPCLGRRSRRKQGRLPVTAVASEHQLFHRSALPFNTVNQRLKPPFVPHIRLDSPMATLQPARIAAVSTG